MDAEESDNNADCEDGDNAAFMPSSRKILENALSRLVDAANLQASSRETGFAESNDDGTGEAVKVELLVRIVAATGVIRGDDYCSERSMHVRKVLYGLEVEELKLLATEAEVQPKAIAGVLLEHVFPRMTNIQRIRAMEESALRVIL